MAGLVVQQFSEKFHDDYEKVLGYREGTLLRNITTLCKKEM